MAVQPGIVDIRTGRSEAGGSLPSAARGESVTSPALHLLIVDPNEFALHSCCEVARGMGFTVHPAKTDEDARRLLRTCNFDVVLLDLKTEGSGLALVEEVRRRRPGASLVVTTAFATVPSAVEAMRLGAVDYLAKPFALEELTTVLQGAASRAQFDYESRLLRDRLRSQTNRDGLTGRSPEMEKLYRMLSKVVPATLPVLISGEPGTGKKRIARLIHRSGPNAGARYVEVHCASSSPSEMAAELFGDARPGLAGAVANGALGHKGATVFLDRVDALPPELQARLLQALQDKQVRAQGAVEETPLQARILAASSCDLKRMADAGSFRRDLYARLNVVNLHVPALRERRQDIPLLAERFLEDLRRERDTAFTLSGEAMELLEDYNWPENVRELECALQRAVALTSSAVLQVGDLTTQLENFRRAREPQPMLVDARNPPVPFFSPGNRSEAGSRLSIAERERRAILSTLEQMQGDKLMAAKLLGIGKTTLYRKLKEYGIRTG